MSDWPPKPHKEQSDHSASPTGQEWKILEKAVLSSVKEQQRSRRWGIFFKFISMLYVLAILIFMFRGCTISGSTENIAGSTEAHLAVVNIIGTIDSGNQSVNSVDTIKSLKSAFEAKGSRAVVLNINSPGGSPVQSDDIWQEIQYLKKQNPDKKVYAVIGDMGASGAYYIASAADQIWVNPSSLVGSIGVIMPNYGVSGLAQKLGIEDRTMTAGSNKDILSMSKPIDAEQKQHIQALLDNVHSHFIQAVKTGRGNKLKSNDPAIFSGLFWTGEQAIKLGIADKAGNLESLKRELDISRTVNYTVERTPFDSILGRMGSEMGQQLGSAVMQQVQSQNQTKLQ